MELFKGTQKIKNFFFKKKMKKEIRNEIKKIEMRERRNNRYLKRKNNLSSLKEEMKKIKIKIKVSKFLFTSF